jgi:uncharacterized membrane protein
MRKGVLALVLVLLVDFCAAATISGTVYDLSLERVEGVVVEVNSSPIQRVVAKQGDYSVELGIGNYLITAEQVSGNITLAYAEELLQVVDDGEYVLDLFLFPSFEEEESLLNETDIDIPEDYMRTTNYLLVAVIILLLFLIAVGVMLYMRSRKPPKIVVESGDDLQRVIKIIESQGGRTTQKEIRKHMPYSEAKVSLIITELEAKGIVEKFKKGRGNIVVLKK